jgi:hypothetical protein
MEIMIENFYHRHPLELLAIYVFCSANQARTIQLNVPHRDILLTETILYVHCVTLNCTTVLNALFRENLTDMQIAFLRIVDHQPQ